MRKHELELDEALYKAIVPLIYKATSAIISVKQCFIEYKAYIHVSKEVHRIGQNVY